MKDIVFHVKNSAFPTVYYPFHTGILRSPYSSTCQKVTSLTFLLILTSHLSLFISITSGIFYLDTLTGRRREKFSLSQTTCPINLWVPACPSPISLLANLFFSISNYSYSPHLWDFITISIWFPYFLYITFILVPISKIQI